jgi:hypothetical protein
MKGTELLSQIKNKIEYLANLVDKAEFSDEIQNYLKTVAKFHHYSPANQWLIMFQKPDASQVAGFHTWKNQFNRHVLKGQKAIRILAPVFKNIENEEGDKIKKLVYFKTVSVFDISQTDGEELAELNVWKSRDKLPELENALKAYAQKLGLKVNINNNIGEAEGMINSKNEIHLKAESGTKTLAHEIAHYLAGHTKTGGHDKPHKIRELEAESTAFTVCDYFGLSADNAPNYLHLTGLTSDDLKNSLDTISQLSKKMITELEALTK